MNKSKLYRCLEYLISLYTIALYASFVLFDSYLWGRYVNFALTVLIFVNYLILNRGRIVLRFDAYVVFCLLFMAYVLASSLWAIKPDDSVEAAATLFRTFGCAYLLYVSYAAQSEFDFIGYIKLIMWAGYVVAIYSLLYYGLDTIIAAGKYENLRLDNSFSNVNTIGMFCALACMIQVCVLVLEKKRFSWTMLLMIPSVVVIAATQSRKALIWLVLGFLCAVAVKASMGNKNVIVRCIKILLICVPVAFAVYGILQLNTFSGIRDRMDILLGSVVGKEADLSITLRGNMRELGWRWFWKNPILGIGVANPHIIAARELSVDTYLHDNFVELLCGGGIVGFILYYGMYVYLFAKLWKYRNTDRGLVAFFAAWLILMLIMNYGMVTYLSKLQNFYLMIHFLNILMLHRKANGHETQTDDPEVHTVSF